MALAIRNGESRDYDAYVRLIAELHIDDPIATRERYVAEVMPRTIMAIDGGAVVGYALFDVLSDVGYVRNLVSDPARRRTGVGVALMDWMRARFVAAGAATWCLNVVPDNAAAIALYERCGLRAAYRTAALRFAPGAPLPAPPTDLALDLAPADEDGPLEREFGLLRGQLTAARPRPSRYIYRLRRGDETLGVTVFMPAVPGGFPFRVRDPAYGVPFAALLRGHAPADAAFFQVTAEDNEPLREAFVAAGARVHLEIEHMRGPLG